MLRYKPTLFMFVTGLLLVFGSAIWLSTATPVTAQCGSQASSCKNCHEVQGQMPVNKDGTAWHQSHAFGDFCYICHAGNNQATDIEAAHAGMVPPLSDVKASCQQCHPNDMDELAQVYASTLGVEIIAGGQTTTAENTTQNSGEQSTSVSALPATKIDINDPNFVDFVQRYDEIVLGKKTVNMGNAILIALIGLVVLGGGGFVIKKEKWLEFSSLDTKPVDGEYPAELVDMLPMLANLKPQTRKSLRKILVNPDRLEKVIVLLDELKSTKSDEEKSL